MPDLNKFISEFKHGFQQDNRFFVQIFVQPQMVANIIVDATSIFGTIDSVLAIPQTVKWLAMGLLAESATIPDRGFERTDLSMYGVTERFPVHSQFSDFSCTFLMPHTTNVPYVDNGVPRFFNYWQNQIQNITKGPDSGMDFRFPSNYYATILLTLLDKKDHGTISYEFRNVYPSVVESARIAWESTNNLIKLPVKFTFSYWKIVPHVESAVISAIDKVINAIL